MKTTAIIISVLFQLVAFNASSTNANHYLTPFLVQTDCYIDDIPFDTEMVTQEYFQHVFSAPVIDATAYVDDIPFETKKVVAFYKAAEAMHVDFKIQAENQIEDIPFDTEAIAASIYQIQFNRMSK